MENESIDVKILTHEKNCWENGPVAALRKEVSGLSAWVKGVGIAIMLLQALNTYSTIREKLVGASVTTARPAAMVLQR